MNYKNILLVLGARPRKDGRPSDQMVSRVRKAVSLFSKNKYSRVIISGGPSSLPIPESEIMRLMMLKFIPDNKLLLERNARDTVQNAVFSWELIKDKKPKKITIVTSAYHLPRAKYIFRKLYKHMGVSLKFEPAQDRFDPVESVYHFIKERFLLARLKIKGFR